MSRTAPLLLLLAAALLAVVPGARSNPLEPIEAAMVAGQYADVLQRVAAQEQRTGPSPRLESIRALALEATGDKLGALHSLLTYFELTRGADLRSNEAHQALVELRDTLQKELREAYEQRVRDDEAQRRERATTALQTAARAAEVERDRLARAYAQAQKAQVQEALKRPTAETIALVREEAPEQATRLDPRALRIADLDLGDLHLGMHAREYAALVSLRAQRYEADTSVIKRAVRDFRFKALDDTLYCVGLVYGWGDGGYTEYGTTFVQDKALWEAVNHKRERHLKDIMGWEHSIMPMNEPLALRWLAPDAVHYRPTCVRFGADRRIASIQIDFVFPWTWRKVDDVRATLRREFGEPTHESFVSHHAAKVSPHWQFTYAAVGDVVLSGELSDSYNYEKERYRTYVLRLTLDRKNR